MSEATQRDTAEMKQWYKGHETTAQLGFNPDGMCQMICRLARNIPPRHPSALSAALATPKEHRVRKISEIKIGSVLHFDDPRDSNPHGHVVSSVARDPKVDPDSLASIFVRTNSVVSGRIVVVRADYFGKHWGDPFMFAADYLNGEPFYDLQDEPKPKPVKKTFLNVEDAIKSISEGIKEIDRAIAHQEKAGNTRFVRALRRDRVALVKARNRMRDAYERNRRGGNA